MRLLLALMIVGASHQRYQTVDVTEVMRYPGRWVGRSIRVCGSVAAQTDGSVIIFSRKHADFGMFISPDLQRTRRGAATCVQGVMRRADGRTEEEATQGQEGGEVITDVVDPRYVLQPR